MHSFDTNLPTITSKASQVCAYVKKFPRLPVVISCDPASALSLLEKLREFNLPKDAKVYFDSIERKLRNNWDWPRDTQILTKEFNGTASFFQVCRAEIPPIVQQFIGARGKRELNDMERDFMRLEIFSP